MPLFKIKAYYATRVECEVEATDEQAAWDKAREESNWEDVTDDTTEEMQLYSCELVKTPVESRAAALTR